MPGTDQAELSAGLAIVELQLGNYSRAREEESKVLQLVQTSHERAEAHNLIGTAWLRESTELPPTLSKLSDAENEFRQASALDPAFYHPYFNLANVLLREGKEREAQATFRESIRAASEEPAIAANLPLLPQKVAPQFSMTDQHGRTVSLNSLKGRYILLEFWATWCPPCVRALPVMRQMATYLPRDQFLLEDKDRTSWQRFISAQEMNWTQVWDDNSSHYRQFELAPALELSLPRYVFLDPDGYFCTHSRGRILRPDDRRSGAND
jgi:tetratricopeptide (TPR) repeat protein